MCLNTQRNEIIIIKIMVRHYDKEIFLEALTIDECEWIGVIWGSRMSVKFKKIKQKF